MTCYAENCYDGPTLSVTINREGNRIHRLIDDTLFPSRPKKVVVRRDPMVAALFGAAPGDAASAEDCAAASASRPPRTRS